LCRPSWRRVFFGSVILGNFELVVRSDDPRHRRPPARIVLAFHCLICGEPDALVGYFWIGGRVAYRHAACDALWKQERERKEDT